MHRIVLSIVLLIGLSGCTSSTEPNSSNLVVGISASPSTLDPRLATDAYGTRIADMTFLSLVKIGSNLELEGNAAESWTVEGNRFVFTLKPDLIFSTGRPLKAEDIHYSFDVYRSDKNPYSSSFREIRSVQVSSPKPNQFQVVVELAKFKANFLTNDLPVLKILPKKEFTDAKDDFLSAEISSGAYTIEKVTPQQIILVRNEHFQHPSKNMEKIIFKVIKDDLTRYQKLKKGDLDIVQSDMPASKVADFESESDKFHVHKYPGLSMTYLLVNLKDKALSHLGLRKSIAQAINRKEIIKYKLEGLATEATSLLTPNNPFHAAGLANIPFDFHRALESFENMGFAGLELVLKSSNNRTAVENAKILANQLNKAGLKIKLENYEWGTFYNDVKTSNFQLATMRWVGVLDPDIYRIAFHSEEIPPKGRNRGGYINKKLDTLLEEGLYERDFEARKGLYSKVQKTILKDLPIIPLWYDEQVAIVNRRVKNYEVAQSSDFTPFLNVHK